MGFTIFVIVAFLAVLAVLLAIGRWFPGTGKEQLDWKPTRSYEMEARLEFDDVEQMLEAQNERRRRTGRPEITEDGVRAEVDAAERDRQRRAAALRAEEEGGGPPE